MKLTNTPPPFCAACHCQNGELRHVDFEAYYDGPVMEGVSYKQPIDDLIICENCLQAAATLVGMVNNKQMRRENFELGRANDEKEKHINLLEKFVSDLEHSLGLALVGKVRRGQGRPALRMPDDETLDKIREEHGVAA